jgi:hypothetical protein
MNSFLFREMNDNIQMPDPKPTVTVINAVRQSQKDLRERLAEQQHAQKGALFEVARYQEAINNSIKALDDLANFLRQYGELDEPEEPVLAQDELKPKFSYTSIGYAGSALKDLVISEAFEVLGRKPFASTDEIFGSLYQKGKRIRVSNPLTRIAQILGEDSRFQSDRSRGWFLAGEKGESPGATGPSSATESDGS